MWRLTFRAGTLEVFGPTLDDSAVDGGVIQILVDKHILKWDVRADCFRAPAFRYFDVVKLLVRAKVVFDDDAKMYGDELKPKPFAKDPRDYQQKAIENWRSSSSRGVVVLPTGSGKTFVACLAIADRSRDTLVVVPTIDLLHQWAAVLEEHFACDVGMVGGGSYEIAPLTIITYDSAYLHMENIGNRFGLVIFDEVHHLPSASYALAARMCLAPFRLGLSATLEREDGGEHVLDELIGEVAYREEINDLKGAYLADYDVVSLVVELDEELREDWRVNREIYRRFVRSQGIRMSNPSGWTNFIIRSAGSEEGQQAMRAYRRQKEIAQAAPQKIEVVEELLEKHANDQVLIFTADNKTAYLLSRQQLLPIITHQTKAKERKRILAYFGEGKYKAIVTSKVLNEGVDLPSASVAIIVSGSGTVREHVQRLGRILRLDGDKRATLYEIVSGDTGETYTSERRRQHDAYR
ncbi:MAG: DEAD/DEAH box helicase [Deltaproteobacteria bacterium]|nr:DEAD/DEAH box helicase [Deltaproteobacteria bacterium]